MSTYSQEVLELKKEILTEISNELKNITNFKIKTNTSPMQNNYCSQYNSDHPRWNMPPSQTIPSYTPCRHPSTVPP